MNWVTPEQNGAAPGEENQAIRGETGRGEAEDEEGRLREDSRGRGDGSGVEDVINGGEEGRE